MIGNIPKNQKEKDKAGSLYMPSNDILELTKKVKQDYATGKDIMDKSYEEFNDKTLSARQNLDQKAFNSYSAPRSTDPDDGWKWKGVRPITRNKIISITAHITANILIPNVFAQNNADEEDKISANVMRWLIEYNIKNSDYDISFLGGVISALTNPAVIVNLEFAEVMQKVKSKNEQGEMSVKEVIDEFFSGLQTHIVPCEELLINNIYEYEIQRQKCLLRRRYASYDVMESKYQDRENFVYVNPGINTFVSEEEGLFYDNKDEAHPTLCEEVIYYNRREDLEIPFVNGIYMGNKDVKDNPMKHRRIVLDENNEMVLIPIYPFAKSGYELIDEKRFFYYKSVAFKLSQEQMQVDTLYRMIMDGTFMQVMPPLAGFGTGAIDGSVMYPGAFTPFALDSKLQKIDNGGRLDIGLNTLEKLEDSMAESSQSETMGGDLPEKEQKASTVARAEQNSKVQLGLFGKMIGRLVVEIGYLMTDIILNHQTIGQLDDLVGDELKMKYKTFLLPDQVKNGKKITKKMVFTDEFMGREMTDEEETKESFKILKEGGEDAEIYKINPELFSKMRFSFSIETDQVLPQSDAFEKAWNLEAYDRGVNDPHIDQEKWTQDHLVETFHKGDSEKYMQKEQPVEQQKPAKSTPVGKLMGSRAGLLG